MDTNQILITFLTSCVPAFLVYLANKYQTDSKIRELKAQSESEWQRLEKEHELRYHFKIPYRRSWFPEYC